MLLENQNFLSGTLLPTIYVHSYSLDSLSAFVTACFYFMSHSKRKPNRIGPTNDPTPTCPSNVTITSHMHHPGKSHVCVCVVRSISSSIFSSNFSMSMHIHITAHLRVLSLHSWFITPQYLILIWRRTYFHTWLQLIFACYILRMDLIIV